MGLEAHRSLVKDDLATNEGSAVTPFRSCSMNALHGHGVERLDTVRRRPDVAGFRRLDVRILFERPVSGSGLRPVMKV